MRVFLAIYPPRDLAHTLSAALPEGFPACRPVPPEQLHVTVFFIGDRSDREIDETIESAQACCAGVRSFELEVSELTVLPERGPKRTVVLLCSRPASLLEMHDRAARRFARPWRPGSRERFLPHLTIGRFGGSGTEIALRTPVQLTAIPIEEVRLVRSELGPGGARHTDVATFRLAHT
jgi:2'-5' RNA ligase